MWQISCRDQGCDASEPMKLHSVAKSIQRTRKGEQGPNPFPNRSVPDTHTMLHYRWLHHRSDNRKFGYWLR